MTAYAQKHEARFVKLLIQQNEMGGKRKLAAAAKQLEQEHLRRVNLTGMDLRETLQSVLE